jgi:hypothetical protein
VASDAAASLGSEAAFATLEVAVVTAAVRVEIGPSANA